MFESAIKSGSSLEIVHNGAQQNGAILGKGCALFLVRFITNLLKKYYDHCKSHNMSNDRIHMDVYENCLKSNLVDMSDEDMNEHGRLICMKDCLLNINTKSKTNDHSLYPYFHRKDL